MEFKSVYIALKGISAYREICRAPLMKRVESLLAALSRGNGEAALDDYTELFYLLRAEGYASLGSWLEGKLRFCAEPYPLLVEAGGSDKVLENAARRDIETFAAVAAMDCAALIAAMKALLGEEYASVLDSLPCWTAEVPFSFDGLTAFYRENGAGEFARYRAFVWENGCLRPVEHPDVAGEEELLGYEMQRQAVIRNTRVMMQGHRANNVLLYGDSGTGKSATVKSLLVREEFADLRIIELRKESLTDMSDLVRLLRDRRQKFILFIDDLAFDQDDRTYSILKSILEGGLEPRPANVAVYATSNRRHLVRQNFSDRTGDEVDITETIQEKTALSDRFGLRVAFLPLNKPEFMALVEGLADLEGVDMDRETLRAEAVKWEVRHPGRTPRTARQFIAGIKSYG